MHRDDYDSKINKLLKSFNLIFDGTRSKIITEGLFDLMDGIDEKTNKERKILAIERAKRNYDRFDHTNPANEESSTTVFRLVEELLKFI